MIPVSGDDWRLVVSEGEAVPIVALDITAPQMMFRHCSWAVGEFAQRWCMAGPSHHIVGAYGKWSESLRKLGGMMDIEVVTV